MTPDTPAAKAAHAREIRDWRWRRAADRVQIDGRLVAVNATTAHGTVSTYGNWMCRCEPCTAAFRNRMAERRAQRAAERMSIDGRLVHPRAPHGTAHGRNYWMCRCPDCVAATSAEDAERYQRHRTEGTQ